MATKHTEVNCIQAQTIKYIKEKQDDFYENFYELFNSKMAGFKAEVFSRLDVQDVKMDKLLKHQEKQNGKVDRHDALLFGFDKMMHETTQDLLIIRAIKKNPFKVAAIVLLLVVVGGLIADQLDIKTLIELLK